MFIYLSINFIFKYSTPYFLSNDSVMLDSVMWQEQTMLWDSQKSTEVICIQTMLKIKTEENMLLFFPPAIVEIQPQIYFQTSLNSLLFIKYLFLNLF